MLLGRHFGSGEEALDALVAQLQRWTQELNLKPLSDYGLKAADLDHVVAHARGSSMKTNPIVLTDEEIKSILTSRM